MTMRYTCDIYDKSESFIKIEEKNNEKEDEEVAIDEV